MEDEFKGNAKKRKEIFRSVKEMANKSLVAVFTNSYLYLDLKEFLK